MEFRYDTEADAIYIYLSDKPYVYGLELDDARRIDYAADDSPIGIELIGASYGVNLDGLPQAYEIAELLECNGIMTYSWQMRDRGYSGTVFDVNFVYTGSAGEHDVASELTEKETVGTA